MPTAHKIRQLLAFLMLQANQAVPIHACIDELWQSDPPKSAVSVTQTYVSEIRKMLRSASPEQGDGILVTRNRNYMLRVRSQDLDSEVFFEHVQRGHAAFGHGELQHAVAYFHRALSQWRGPALLDVPNGPAITMQRERLEETRFGVEEQRVEAELRLGLHHEILAELQVQAEAYPLRENVQAQYMVALYRCGRQVHAVNVYWRLRRTLSEQFGLDPSPRMQRLHQAILTSDPALDLPTLSPLRRVAG
ncbi:AfsR/SARP family transcriptional regulator [Actinomadura sp. BRA 177]|uniref:AfsR/SARP family transcriptional regulator n=1 Tax=Actinomadura sp. BRA 177 TaxID=2745202 RepID=UPI0015950CED|nr:AfsR/SARP family transcriptional regulator [Actinomadura sp. BRA 177]NVI91421.1 AfsR/SARP family transcriptional regulator [Actinomadura sp. BRA 177]